MLAHPSSPRQRFFAGFHRCLPAIGVHCDLDEIDRRERERGDRRLREGRSHVIDNGIHAFGPYDLDVDTTAGVTTDMAATVIDARRRRLLHPALR